MKNLPVVYIASPYTKGDVAINVRSQHEIFNVLMDSGVVLPVAPLWSHYQHIMFPRQYQDWIDYDLAMLPRYDACLRMTSIYKSGRVDYMQIYSSGAENEVQAFRKMKKPVFFSIHDCTEWAEKLLASK